MSEAVAAGVGPHIAAAFARAVAHGRVSNWRVRVRIASSIHGISIAVDVPVRSVEDFNALTDVGHAFVGWGDLDHTAPHLTELVDRCVAEVERRFGASPSVM